MASPIPQGSDAFGIPNAGQSNLLGQEDGVVEDGVVDEGPLVDVISRVRRTSPARETRVSFLVIYLTSDQRSAFS